MKKALVFALSLMMVASTVFAANFVPTLLKISASPMIQYNFDGSTLDIPVTVKGTPATALLLVFTKDLAATMPTVHNGYLGWHTVNKIDTCIYSSAGRMLDVGTNHITWDGKNQDGKAVPKGEYTYYIWGYDSVNAKVFAAPIPSSTMSGNSVIITRDYKGNSLPTPYIYSAPMNNPANAAEVNPTMLSEGYRMRNKWTLGNDPQDATLVETTQWLAYGGNICSFTPSPYESDMFYDLSTDDNLLGHIRKWKWVPNGNATKDEDWGDDGEFRYTINTGQGWWVSAQDMRYVGGDFLAATQTDHSGSSTESELVIVNATDGSEEFRIDLAQWWVSISDGEAGGQQASGPNKFDVVGDKVFLGAHSSCANQMIVPTAGKEEEEWNRWVNMNGDYTGDHNFETDAARPWVCHDYNVGPYKYQIKADSNLFSVFPSFDMGAVSFGLYAPDGTGLKYFAYSGETAGGKQSSTFLDDNTPYDGLYMDNTSSGGTWDGNNGYHFVAHDSIKGVITNQVAVEEAPAAFAVAQNSPNPFNPTTTISFAITEAGTVSIDVFNVAGQKVDTIANEFMSVGSHSVTWDASGHSAGVYFYTVKTGSFSETMKMTLLK